MDLFLQLCAKQIDNVCAKQIDNVCVILRVINCNVSYNKRSNGFVFSLGPGG